MAYTPGSKLTVARGWALAAVMSLAALFPWIPAAAQWSGHTSSQRYPAPRSSVVNLFEVEEAVLVMTNDIRRQGSNYPGKRSIKVWGDFPFRERPGRGGSGQG